MPWRQRLFWELMQVKDWRSVRENVPFEESRAAAKDWLSFLTACNCSLSSSTRLSAASRSAVTLLRWSWLIASEDCSLLCGIFCSESWSGRCCKALDCSSAPASLAWSSAICDWRLSTYIEYKPLISASSSLVCLWLISVMCMIVLRRSIFFFTCQRAIWGHAETWRSCFYERIHQCWWQHHFADRRIKYRWLQNSCILLWHFLGAQLKVLLGVLLRQQALM